MFQNRYCEQPFRVSLDALTSRGSWALITFQILNQLAQSRSAQTCHQRYQYIIDLCFSFLWDFLQEDELKN